jgi:hypothetical protein
MQLRLLSAASTLMALFCVPLIIAQGDDEESARRASRPEPEAEYVCKRAEVIVEKRVQAAAPPIDGLVEDAAWKVAFWHDLAVVGQEVATDRVALMYDEKYLYFAGDFIDADVQSTTGAADTIVLQLRPIGSELIYTFTIDAAGLVTSGHSGDLNEVWSSTTVEAISMSTDSGWSVEGRLEMAELMPPKRLPMVRDVWGYRFERNDRDANRTTSAVSSDGMQRMKLDSEPVRAMFLKYQTMARLMEKTSFVNTQYAVARKIDKLKVVSEGVTFKFEPMELGWLSETGQGRLALADANDFFLPSMLSVHPVSATQPIAMTWTSAAAQRVLIFACVGEKTVHAIAAGKSDGTLLTVTTTGASDDFTETLKLVEDEWQLSLLRILPETHVSITVDPGPSGNGVADETYLAVYKVPWKPKAKSLIQLNPKDGQ